MNSSNDASPRSPPSHQLGIDRCAPAAQAPVPKALRAAPANAGSLLDLQHLLGESIFTHAACRLREANFAVGSKSALQARTRYLRCDMPPPPMGTLR